MTELKPCNKFFSNSTGKQLWHITTELWEVCKAWVAWKLFGGYKYALVEEIIDLQTACQTMLVGSLEVHDSNISAVRIMVIRKNRARGYYEGDTHV